MKKNEYIQAFAFQFLLVGVWASAVIGALIASDIKHGYEIGLYSWLADASLLELSVFISLVLISMLVISYLMLKFKKIS